MIKINPEYRGAIAPLHPTQDSRILYNSIGIFVFFKRVKLNVYTNQIIISDTIVKQQF